LAVARGGALHGLDPEGALCYVLYAVLRRIERIGGGGAPGTWCLSLLAGVSVAAVVAVVPVLACPMLLNLTAC
jgi:hypothetical protein